MLPNFFKRSCAMLVALGMLLSCVPLSALAETVEDSAVQNTETFQEEAPAAQDEGASQEEVPAPEPVASVEIPTVVENAIDNAEEIMAEVAQSEQTTMEEIENKLDSLDDAEAAVEDQEDLTDAAEDKVDDLEEAIPDVQDAVNEEILTETQGKDILMEQHAETEAALDAAKKQQEEAAAALEQAKQDYEAAQALSEEAQAAAMEKLLAAQEELAKAEQNTAVAKQAVDAVAEALNNIHDAVDQAHENAEALVEDLTASLEESKEELKASVENLTQTAGEIKENTETLITELENLQASAEKFEESVVNAMTTEEKALGMRAEYEEAMKALEAAQAAYDALIAEGGDVTDEELQVLSDAIAAAEATAAKMKEATDIYETEAAKSYEQNLNILGSTEATDEEKAAAEKAVAGTLVTNHANGKVEWIDAGESEYGKSDDGYYVVLDDEGNVVGRYGYKLEDGVLNVYEMKSNGTTYFIGTGENRTEVTDNVKDEDGSLKDAFNINGTDYYKEDDKYYYNESADSTTHSDPVEVNFKSIENEIVAGAVKVILGDNYSISELTKQDDGTYTFTVNYTKTEMRLEGWKPVFESVPAEATFVIGSDNTISTKGDNALEDYVGYLFDVTTDDYDTIDGYRVYTDENGQLYYIDENGNTVNINQGEAGYYYKRDAKFAEGETSDLTFTMGNVSNSDSAAAYGEKKEQAFANLNNANNDLNDAQTEYNTAKTQYDKLQAELDKMAEAENKDLEIVIPGISIGGFQITQDETVGNLADLPVSIDELLNLEDFQDPEKLAELVDAVQNIGSGETDISSLTTLYELVGLDAADILALTSAATLGNDFQKEYAAAWVDALTAKVNVVISGIELIDQAGKTMEAGKELLASGAEVPEQILEVAQNAAKVIGYTGALGVVQLGDKAYELIDPILTKLENKVAYLQIETNAAYKEVSEAKAALDEVIQNYHDPYALALQEAKARLEEAESKYNALAKDLKQANAELKAANIKISNISAPQKATESETSNTPAARTFVLDKTRFQVKDASDKALDFTYSLEGNTLVVTVTHEKALIVIEVAYMAELVSQGIQVVEFRTANGTYVLNMSTFLEAHPEVTGTVEIDLGAGTYSYVLNGNAVSEKLELKK